MVLVLFSFAVVGTGILRPKAGFPQRRENLEVPENLNGHVKVMEHEKLAKVMKFCDQ